MLSSIHPGILILAGILTALFGYKIQKAVLTVGCFCIGFSVMQYVCPNFISDQVVSTVISIVVGLLVSGLGVKIEKLAVGLTVGYLVYASIGSYANYLPFELTQISKLVTALVCGLIGMLMIKPILIIVTSIAGASILLLGAASYITIPSSIYLIVLVSVIVISIFVQYKTT
jgi:hypothetical protein